MATRRFEVFSVLVRSGPIWARNCVKFAVLHLIVYAPLFLYAIADAALGGPTRAYVVLGFGLILLWFVSPLAVVHGVLEELHGSRATFRGCFRVYLGRLLPAVGVGLSVGFFVAVSLFLAGLFIGLLLGVGGVRPAPQHAALLLGIPATFVASIYWVAVPVAACENAGVGRALQRSARLTMGSRARVFVLALIVTLLQALPGLLPLEDLAWWLVIPVLLAVGSFGAVVTSVAYHDLSLLVDGARSEDVAKVFA